MDNVVQNKKHLDMIKEKISPYGSPIKEDEIKINILTPNKVK